MPGYNVSDTQLKGAAEGVSKYRCPECRLLLRDAVQPSCGHWLCQTCAELLFRKGRPRCPRDDCHEALVPEDGQDFFPDRFVRREILNFPVYCSNGSLGCDWEGHLSQYEDHVEKCSYTQVVCECGEKMLLTEVEEHKNTSCPKSKNPCPLAQLGCLEKSMLTKDEMYSHFAKNGGIVNHMKIMASVIYTLQDKVRATEALPERPPTEGADPTVDSGYKSLGNADVERDGAGAKDGSRSFKPLGFVAKDGPRDFQALAFAPDTHRLMSVITKTVSEEVGKLRKEMRREYLGEIELRDGKIKALEHQTAQLQKSIQTKNAEIEDRDFRLSLIENSNYDGTMIWKIPQFSQRMTDAKTGKYTSIFSLPFYSSRYGYKMCLRLYIMGDGIGKGSHMSLFFVIMKGEFDNILTWPFTQRVTFRLINQSSGRDIVDTFQPDPMSSSFKKPKSDMNIASGCPRFITHESLKSGGYIEDDTIFIKCVVDRSAILHP